MRSPQATAPRESQAEDGLGSILVGLIAAPTLAGVIVYIAIRFGLSRFYTEFGLEPEDVGLGYQETLSRTTAGLLYLLYSVLIIGLLTAGLIYAIHRFSPWQPPMLRDRDTAIAIAILAGVLVTVLLMISIFDSTDELIQRVHNGEPVRPGFPNDEPWTWNNPLGIRVEPVEARWIGDDKPAQISSRYEYMYFGSSSGHAVLYDVTNRRTLRLPESQLVLIRSDVTQDGDS